MEGRRDGIETRRKILEAACEVFAEMGYRGATNAEICRRSGVNGAAVNYHFRSKEALYVAAFRRTLEESIRAHPAGGEDRTLPPAQRLKEMIRSVICRISDPGNKSFAMLHKEMNEPTGLLDGVMGEFLGDEMEWMKAVVAEILGSAVSPKTAAHCAMSVMAQCVHPALAERRKIDMKRPPPPSFGAFDQAEMAEHVFEFSFAALAAISAKAAGSNNKGSL